MVKRSKIPNLTGLKAFDAVCRTGSVNAASIDLKVTPGAISRQISQLENALGRALFLRKGGRLQLTDTGKAYDKEIRAAFDLIEKATLSLSETHQDNKLVISCPPSFHFCWLLKRLRNFEASHKDIWVTVHTELSTHMRSSHIDAYISVGAWPSDPELKQTKFMANYSGPVMAPQLAGKLLSGNKRIPEELRLLTLRKIPSIWEDWLFDTGRTVAPKTEYAELDHLFLTIEAAKAGLGAAIAPYSYVFDDINSGALIAPYGFLERKVPYFIAWHPGDRKKQSLQAFIHWLKREGAETPTPEPPTLA